MSNTAPFLHIAYANNNTGTLDFTTTGGIERTFTGFYTDEYSTDSSDPSKYKWLTNAEFKNKVNTAAYANSADGTDGFTTVYPNLNLFTGTSDKPSTKTGNNWNNAIIGVYSTPKVGQEYTISVEVPEADHDVIFEVFRWNNAGGRVDLLTSKLIKSGEKAYVTFTWPDPGNSGATQIASDLVWTNGTDTGSYSYCKAKLEPGSVATPYMPSSSEVKDSDYPQYIGFSNVTNPTTFKDYEWTLLENIPAPGSIPPVVDNTYILTMPTVKTINLTYGIGTLTTKPVSWLSTKPKLDVNQVLWYKSEITGTDNSVGVYYSNLVGGANLDDGDSPLDNTVVSIVLNNKTVNVPRDLALKLELLSQTLNKRDDSLAQLIADTNDRITNIDMGSGQAGLNQEVIDRKNADDALGVRIDTVTGNVNDLTTTTQTKFTNIEKQLGGFSVQGTKNSSLTRPSIVFNYNAYGATLPDGSSDGGGRLYYQVPGDTNYDVKELKFNYQTIPSFYDMDQITIWEKSWSTLYGGFNWRDTIITTTDIDTFYIDGMTTYYDYNGDLIIRGKVVMDGIDDWIGSMSNRGFKPDTVVIKVASDLNSVKSIRFTGDMGVIEMTMSLGYGTVAQVQRLGRRVSFYGSSPIGQFSTTSASWTSLSDKITYGIRPIRGLEFAVNTFGNNSSLQYAFDSNGSIRVHQSVNNANQYQVMGQVGWQTFDQYPPSNYTTYSAWTNR